MSGGRKSWGLLMGGTLPGLLLVSALQHNSLRVSSSYAKQSCCTWKRQTYQVGTVDLPDEAWVQLCWACCSSTAPLSALQCVSIDQWRWVANSGTLRGAKPCTHRSLKLYCSVTACDVNQSDILVCF